MFPTFWRWSWVHYCLPYNLQVLSVRKVDVQVNIRSSPPTVWSSLISLLHLLFSFSSWAYQSCIITQSVLFSWLQALGLWCYDLSNHYLCSIISTISFFLMSKTKFSSKSMEVFFPFGHDFAQGIQCYDISYQCYEVIWLIVLVGVLVSILDLTRGHNSISPISFLVIRLVDG